MKIILQEFNDGRTVTIEDEYATDTQAAVQMCYNGLIALGHSPINVAAGFAELGDEILEVINFNK